MIRGRVLARVLPVFLLALALAAGCSGKSSTTTTPATCSGNVGDACTLGTGALPCCTGTCDGAKCAPPCSGNLGDACTTGGAACCQGTCDGTKCSAGATCVADVCTQGGTPCCLGTCQSGHCTTGGGPTCLDDGTACAGSQTPCCSGHCDTTKNQCTNSTYCADAGGECSPTRPTDCCTGECFADSSSSLGGRCSTSTCISSFQADGVTPSTVACTSASQCCSGYCSGSAVSSGTCQTVPTTVATCHTLYEACAGPLQCCSTNCVAGVCEPAYACHAYGDICYRAEDCCSSLCTATSGAPGRCVDPSGGCVQDGNPCDNASNCCTRLCLDVGGGAKVCQPAGGCRMTGDTCDTTAACCGGTPDGLGPKPGGGYNVYCDTPANIPPDTGKSDDYRCTRGQGCNPPGNICGGSGATNASQNCCTTLKGSGSQVCKADMNGIYRCFGGGSASCPTGWDGKDPACCIQEGQICQFRDQCCNLAPCVPDAQGVLRCSTTSSCLSLGSACGAPGADPCCSGTSCIASVEPAGNFCLPPTTPPTPGSCAAIGTTCTAGSECCSAYCADNGTGTTVCTSPTGQQCLDPGATCTFDAQCCAGACIGGKCGVSCVPTDGYCTVTADCCSGNTCVLPYPSATSGTCKAGSGTQCANLGQSCSGTVPCCDTTQVCGASGTCEVPPPPCSDVAQGCAVDGDCCSGLSCLNNATGTPTACNGASGCTCDYAASCVNPPTACDVSHPCCTPYFCFKTGTYTACSAADTSCVCATPG